MFYDEGWVDHGSEALRELGAVDTRVHPSQPDKAFFDAIVRWTPATSRTSPG